VEPTSPARVLLGIDKGLRAQDVSLKRAASFHTRSKTPGGLSRANSSRQTEAPRGKSFSERIAESRNKEKEKEEKQARIEKSRNAGFGTRNIESLREGAPSRGGSSLSTEMRSSHAPSVTSGRVEISKSRSIGDLRHASQKPSSAFFSRTESRAPSAASSHAAPSRPISRTAAKYAEIAERDNSTEAASFDSFSGLHLKTRNMQHKDLTRILEGKTVVTIPQLLKTVKAPEYDPPDMENDYVVFGVICSKSPPKDTQNARKNQSTDNQETNYNNQGGKFMMMNLTDLKWEVGLYLFDTGFSEFWKLPVGTLIAILNPDIMPPRVRDTGKFSLKLTSSDDTVLEVGTVRDLDFCHALKQGGKECGQWIDGRKTEYCDFHIERHIEKSKRGRMEVNTMTGFGNGPGGGGKFGMFAGGGAGRGAGLKSEELRREGKFHDRTLHETMYIAPSAGAAARLLDEADSGFERGASRAERHRKQLAEKEKERELAKKLGQIGSGAGGDYMRMKGTDASDLPARGDSRTQSSNTSKENSNGFGDLLGLAGKKADDVSLAPVKRKRVISGKSTASSEPVGWGGANRRGLLSPKKQLDPSAGKIRETSPIKKKARLLLPEKGIREPGRESLGTMDIGLLAAMDDDDDDLEVV
jgi:minichromosome maintenance protein 10